MDLRGTAPKGKNLEKAAEFLNTSPAYINFGVQEAKDPHNNQYNVTKVGTTDNKDQVLKQLSELLGCDLNNISDDKLNLLRQAAGVKEEDVDKANKVFDLLITEHKPNKQQGNNN